MKVQIPERGGIVQSEQGRDKGALYVICEVAGGDIFVADGVKRKLSNPKKKNCKHVRLLPQNAAQAGIIYPWDKAFDVRTARLLKELGRESK